MNRKAGVYPIFILAFMIFLKLPASAEDTSGMHELKRAQGSTAVVGQETLKDGRYQLRDGRIVFVVGGKLYFVDDRGKPKQTVPAGAYTTRDGRLIKVGAGGIITVQQTGAKAEGRPSDGGITVAPNTEARPAPRGRSATMRPYNIPADRGAANRPTRDLAITSVRIDGIQTGIHRGFCDGRGVGEHITVTVTFRNVGLETWGYPDLFYVQVGQEDPDNPGAQSGSKLHCRWEFAWKGFPLPGGIRPGDEVSVTKTIHEMTEGGGGGGISHNAAVLWPFGRAGVWHDLYVSFDSRADENRLNNGLKMRVMYDDHGTILDQQVLQGYGGGPVSVPIPGPRKEVHQGGDQPVRVPVPAPR